MINDVHRLDLSRSLIYYVKKCLNVVRLNKYVVTFFVLIFFMTENKH